jgi:LysM repeat protein
VDAEQTATESPAVTLTTESTQDTFEYTVRAGDTLGTISEKFQTPQQIIRELNFLLDDNIFAGQILNIPYVPGMTAEGAPTPTPQPYRHTVVAGESLSSIAALYGVATIQIVEANNIQDPNAVAVGDELLIPGYQPVASPGPATDEEATAPVTGTSSEIAPGDAVVHVVQPGESFLSIAADYGVDPVELAAANNITNRNLIRVGQQLIIPGITQQDAIAARGIRHTVKSGESLSTIAQQYGVTVEEIMAFNGIDDPNTIMVGQELIVPQE